MMQFQKLNYLHKVNDCGITRLSFFIFKFCSLAFLLYVGHTCAVQKRGFVCQLIVAPFCVHNSWTTLENFFIYFFMQKKKNIHQLSFVSFFANIKNLRTVAFAKLIFGAHTKKYFFAKWQKRRINLYKMHCSEKKIMALINKHIITPSFQVNVLSW